MQTRVDEYSSDKHLKMSFVEFLEALARAANYLSYPPPTYETKYAYQKKEVFQKNKKEESKEEKDEEEYDEDIVLSKEEQINQPLNKKIENILPYLLVHCTKRVFKKKWSWPIKNPKYGLYEEQKSIPVPRNKEELKETMKIGINKLIFSKVNIQDLLAKKRRGEI